MDLPLFVLLLAAGAFSAGAFGDLEARGQFLHPTELILIAVFLASLWRLGISGVLGALRGRAVLIFIGLFLAAGVVGALRGLGPAGFDATLYDIQLFEWAAVVPLVVLVANTRARVEWLYFALVAVAAIATLLYLGAEVLARATTSESLLADQEGEIGSGALFACFCLAAALPFVARAGRRAAIAVGLAVGGMAIFLIGLADKRTAWVAGAGLFVVALALSRGHWRRLAAMAAVIAAVIGTAVAVNAATELTPEERGASPNRPAFVPMPGPLADDFEDGSNGWRVLGEAASNAPVTTSAWSAGNGVRSLHVDGVADADQQNAYAFACDCCSGGAGIPADPGQRYHLRATIRAERAPPGGVGLRIMFYADDGTFDAVGIHRSARSVRTNQTERIGVSAVAPADAKIAGVFIGPEVMNTGDEVDFMADDVSFTEGGKTGASGLACGGEGSGGGPGGSTQVEKELTGFLGGTSREGENVSWRLAFWGELLERLGDDPVEILTGAGFGPTEFVRDGDRYDFRVAGSPDPNNVSGPHNAFVGALYLSGIVALVGLAGILVAAALRLFRGLRSTPDGRAREILVGLTGMLVVSIVYMSFTESIRTPELALAVWTCVGLIIAWPLDREEPQEPSSSTP